MDEVRMDDVDKLEIFLENKVDYEGTFYGFREFNLQELIALRELAQMAIVQRLCEYSPVMFEPIFKDKL